MKSLNQSLRLGHLLCRSRHPDFLLNIIQRQVSSTDGLAKLGSDLFSLKLEQSEGQKGAEYGAGEGGLLLRNEMISVLHLCSADPVLSFSCFLGFITINAMAGRSGSI